MPAEAAVDAASTLASYILPKLENGEWRKILFVPTGALMSWSASMKEQVCLELRMRL